MEVHVVMLLPAMEPTIVLFVNVHLACQAILKLHACLWDADPIWNVLLKKLASMVIV
jgi:hypothetical protein